MKSRDLKDLTEGIKKRKEILFKASPVYTGRDAIIEDIISKGNDIDIRWIAKKHKITTSNVQDILIEIGII